MGSAGFTLLPHACLPLYFVILLRQSISIMEIFLCLRYLTPTRIPKVSPPAYEYDATSSFDNKTGECDLTKHAGTFFSFLFPLLRAFFSFFFAFSAAMPCKSAKPDVLEAANYSSRSKTNARGGIYVVDR